MASSVLIGSTGASCCLNFSGFVNERGALRKSSILGGKSLRLCHKSDTSLRSNVLVSTARSSADKSSNPPKSMS